MHLTVKRSSLTGSLSIPPSKSQTMRALLFAALAKGTSTISNILPSPDTEAMITALRQCGTHIEGEQVHGGNLRAPTEIIDAGNSGLVLRFMGALAGLFSAETVITGDHSLQTNRPSMPLVQGLIQLGASATGSYAPLSIRGPLQGGMARIDGRDSQPVSALLIASSFARAPTELLIDAPGEKPWVDLTLSWFDRLGLPYKRDGYTRYALPGKSEIMPFTYVVPPDLSTLAFPLAAALITRSQVTFTGIDLDDAQGDKKLIETLIAMGARIRLVGEELRVDGTDGLFACDIDIDDYIDALPILSVICCYAQGTSRIRNVQGARRKESDRVSAMGDELTKMGGDISFTENSMIIRATELRGTRVTSHADHRVAMALAVAGLGAGGTTHIEGAECIQKTFPSFCAAMKQIGATIHEHHLVRI